MLDATATQHRSLCFWCCILSEIAATVSNFYVGLPDFIPLPGRVLPARCRIYVQPLLWEPESDDGFSLPASNVRDALPERGNGAAGRRSKLGKSMKILLYNPDNGVTQNFMPHLWMFLLQSLTPPEQEVLLIDGNTQPLTDAELVEFARS